MTQECESSWFTDLIRISNSIFEVLKTGRDFQYVQFSCFTGSTLLVEKLCRLEEGCIRDKLSHAEIH